MASTRGTASAIPPDAQNQPQPEAVPQRDGELKRLLDLQSDRTWCFVQYEQEGKREKKFQNDLSRCPPSSVESAPYVNILKHQVEQCQKNRKKYLEHINLLDSKFISASYKFLDKYVRSEEPVTQDNAVKREEVEARLEGFRAGLKSSFGKQLDDAVDKIKSSQSTLESENRGLKRSLEEEKERNDRLERRLELLDQKLNTLSRAHSGLSTEVASQQGQMDSEMAKWTIEQKEVLGRLEWLSLNTVGKADVSETLKELDSMMSSDDSSRASKQSQNMDNAPGCKTRAQLRKLADTVESIKSILHSNEADSSLPMIQNVQRDIKDCAKDIKTQSTQCAQMSEAIRSLEASLRSDKHSRQPASRASSASSNHKGPPDTTAPDVMEERLQRLSDSLASHIKADMQLKLNKVATEIGSFVDKERCKTQEAADKAEKSQVEAQSLRRDVDQLKGDFSSFTAWSRSQLAALDTGMQVCNDALTNLDARLRDASKESAEHLQALAVQLQVLHAWQANFTTKPLYRDIVEHINATLPKGIPRQVSALTDRISALEGMRRQDDEAEWRKRKLQHN
ncbi:hypothetical protein UVI_02001190 [Ustilaginoidea virens]|uniref:Uncharacterized protein n=1 Tax=Ustilaginoidea virens TaxID=1159556 RepID=A0A063CAJ6_USTVR|nr:hypothetical protein UVI_02001190 [Ustilaginoidea virens]